MSTITAPVAVPVETVTPMKPSEAMRLGCLIAPVQTDGRLFRKGSACALGAMALGYGVRPDEVEPCETWWWPAGDDREFAPASCPVGGGSYCFYSDQIGVVTWHLNDDHRWPRERIADWLAGLGL